MSAQKLTLQLRDLIVFPEEMPQAEHRLHVLAADALGVGPEHVDSIEIVRRALDARARRPRFVFTVRFQVAPELGRRVLLSDRVQEWKPKRRARWFFSTLPPTPAPVVVGSGPAGLFAAWTLARAGWPPILFERGKAVELRAKDVSKLYSRGVLDPESNVCFGEGGAGTFSDGKLYTRVNDARVRQVLELMVALGADPDILINARPHIGTDRLVVLLKQMRRELEDKGVQLRYETRVNSFEIVADRLSALRLAGGERLECNYALVATGHSAREVWLDLHRQGIVLEARPFAVGFRIEHPQDLINELRYGCHSVHEALPAADYRVTYNERDEQARSVYSFCMCPGGVVVATPTEQRALCINGMSHASRSGRYANSALVVTVKPSEFGAQDPSDVFAGVAFQGEIEREAYRMGGGGFTAPAARVTDFLEGRSSSTLPGSSYRRGLVSCDLRTLYPKSINSVLCRALRRFDRQMQGFVSEEATLIGAETRTASPIRLPRGENCESLQVEGLYPAGEGMGYGGGIMSAAVDGIRAAEAMLARAGAEIESRPT